MRFNPDGDRPPAPATRPELDRSFAVAYTHRIRFTRDVFDPGNSVLRDVLEADRDAPNRAVVFIDSGVAEAWPDLEAAVRGYAAAHPDLLSIAGEVAVVAGGERAKNDWSDYQRVTAAIDDSHICRQSYVFAIGGGAMLDAVGFAAATAHRGVRLIRFPTTTLSQDDAGIGVKNGINAFGKKNFLGTFRLPWAVINDESFLATLSDRDWRSGFSEAVKVALLKDAAFFRHIEAVATHLGRRDEATAAPIIRRSAELHLDHIALGGDPFELLNARPLDFGHWSAHKIEQLSGFRIKHGEAVAIGLALDVLYSVASGRLAPSEADRILSCLARIGFALYDGVLEDRERLMDGLEEFREHLGGRLTITLLEGIGRPVDVHEVDRNRMCESIDRLAEHAMRLGA